MKAAVRASPVPGWHGKLPTLGDFATRRLDGAFVHAWDAWLAAGLDGLRRLPGWLDAYLASPVWRFVLMPGVLPLHGGSEPTAWAGVLMASVDRVGRYYPLTIAHPIETLPSDGAALDALTGWLSTLDDLAADALHDDWTIAALEAALERVGAPPAAPAAPASSGVPPAASPVRALPLDAARGISALLGAQAAALWQEAMRGRAFWHAAAAGAAPRLLASAGLAPGLPAELFGGADAPVPPSVGNGGRMQAGRR